MLGCSGKGPLRKVWPEGSPRHSGEERGKNRVGSLQDEGMEFVMFASRSSDDLTGSKNGKGKVICRSALAPRRANSFHGRDSTMIVNTDSHGHRRSTHVRISGRNLSEPTVVLGRDVTTPSSVVDVDAAYAEEWTKVKSALVELGQVAP
eukprot:CAMPEP_0118933494 /NCGR_PEP_ID=MMETSP1169-20130426/12017_1 /TAXON_ID=36882 /ORGANISM="Pyramimonas obovata, Strain CCMP722" /LENGTH=148 /DNA_ID=CAMNT_0006876259 /DNA_START=296 /DNA_END=742 /DNA_ORIENTATION=+